MPSEYRPERAGCLPKLLLVATLLASAAVQASDALCPDDRATTGLYRNYSYGFTVVIPRGLEGWWNSPACVPGPPEGCVCMGDHGRDVPLRGGGSISIYADPQVFEASLATAAYRDLHAFEARTDASELVVRLFGQRRLRALPSYRYIATSSEAAHVTLPSGGYVVISIEAPEQQYRKHHLAYLALLNSLRPSPLR
jgi:hypothetical protein